MPETRARCFELQRPAEISLRLLPTTWISTYVTPYPSMLQETQTSREKRNYSSRKGQRRCFAIEARQTIFGTILTGGIGENVESDEEEITNQTVVQKLYNLNIAETYDENKELSLSSREIPLDIVLRKKIVIEDADTNVSEDYFKNFKKTRMKTSYKM